MRNRVIAVAAAALVTLIGGFAVSGGRVYVYNDLNAGIVVDAPFGLGCLGLEVKGAPGFFGGTDPGECDI